MKPRSEALQNMCIYTDNGTRRKGIHTTSAHLLLCVRDANCSWMRAEGCRLAHCMQLSMEVCILEGAEALLQQSMNAIALLYMPKLHSAPR